MDRVRGTRSLAVVPWQSCKDPPKHRVCSSQLLGELGWVVAGAAHSWVRQVGLGLQAVAWWWSWWWLTPSAVCHTCHTTPTMVAANSMPHSQ